MEQELIEEIKRIFWQTVKVEVLSTVCDVPFTKHTVKLIVVRFVKWYNTTFIDDDHHREVEPLLIKHDGSYRVIYCLDDYRFFFYSPYGDIFRAFRLKQNLRVEEYLVYIDVVKYRGCVIHPSGAYYDVNVIIDYLRTVKYVHF